MAQQHAAVRALEGRISIGKMFADIAQRGRTEQGIAQGMQQHITIGMGQQAEFMGNLHAAQGDKGALTEAVHIVAVANTHKKQRPEKVRA